MFWIFIVNDLVIGNITLSAEQIATYLLKCNNWRYSKLAPNSKHLKKGDTVLIYLAGKGRRCFFATFTLAGDIGEFTNVKSSTYDWEIEFNRFYPLASPIDNIQVYKNCIPLNKELRTKLGFIIDKKNWGLYFRQGIRVLPENDFHTITSAVNMEV